MIPSRHLCRCGAKRNPSLDALQWTVWVSSTPLCFNSTQIFVGVAGTSFLYMFSLPYNGLKQRGIWVTISLVMILEPSMGATWKKGPMRVIGTGIGGCVGAFVMACAHAAAGGNDAAWQDRSGPAKIICTTLLLAFSCSLLQLLRLIDPPCAVPTTKHLALSTDQSFKSGCVRRVTAASCIWAGHSAMFTKVHCDC